MEIVNCFALIRELDEKINPYLESYITQLSKEAFTLSVDKLQNLIDIRALEDEQLQDNEEEEIQGCPIFRESIKLLDVFVVANKKRNDPIEQNKFYNKMINEESNLKPHFEDWATQ